MTPYFQVCDLDVFRPLKAELRRKQFKLNLLAPELRSIVMKHAKNAATPASFARAGIPTSENAYETVPMARLYKKTRELLRWEPQPEQDSNESEEGSESSTESSSVTSSESEDTASEE